MKVTKDLANWNMERDVLLRIKYLADSLEIDPQIVVQNVVIDHWARQAATYQVEGEHAINPEFSWEVKPDGTKQLVTGEKLFYSLVEYYKKELVEKVSKLKSSSSNHPVTD